MRSSQPLSRRSVFAGQQALVVDMRQTARQSAPPVAAGLFPVGFMGALFYGGRISMPARSWPSCVCCQEDAVMRFTTSFIAVALLLGAVPGAGAPEVKGAAELAKALDGRVAGEAVDCLNLRDIRSTRIISDTAILYETIDGTLYVNRPRSGQRFLDKWDVLVTDTHSDRLCSIDIVYLYDQSPWVQTGSIGLGEFVPYRKPRR